MGGLPFYLVLLQSFPETVILIYLGLGVTGLKLDWRRILLVSLLIALSSYIIHMTPLPAGINILIQLLLLVGLLSILGRLSFAHASLVGVLGLVVLSFFEITVIALITAITGIPITQVMNDPWMRLFFPLPEFAVLGLIAFLLNKYRERVIAWSRNQYPHITNVLWKSQIALLLLLSVILISFGFYYENYIGETQPLASSFISNAMYYVIFTVIAVSLLLISKIIFCAETKPAGGGSETAY